MQELWFLAGTYVNYIVISESCSYGILRELNIRFSFYFFANFFFILTLYGNYLAKET